ncbi:MAG: RNA 2',3'-cyclic phosphodiesterase [Dehalococcoidia bacterium]
MAKIRAFVAIELTPEMQRALGEVQARVKAAIDAPVRWVAPESTHLTLKFLGDIDHDQVEPIASAMAQAASDAQPFTLGLADVGGFPSLARPRVLWVGLRGDPPDTSGSGLVRLQSDLERRLEPLGFARERRPFTPHLTLGRVRSPGRLQWSQDPGGLGSPGAAHRVESVSLMQSILRPQGAAYHRLSSARLGRG